MPDGAAANEPPPPADHESSAGSAADSAPARPLTYPGVFAPRAATGVAEPQRAAGPGGGDAIGAGQRVGHGHAGVYVPSRWHAAAFPGGDDSGESSSDEDGSEESEESDDESYEGLAVDDINETYDHRLPEYVPNPDPHTQRIYLDEEGIAVDVRGMSHSPVGLWLFRLLGVLTLGVAPLVCRWVPRWRIWWTMRPAPLSDADFAVAVDEFGAVSVQRIERCPYGGTLESVFGSLTRKGPLSRFNDDVVACLATFAYRHYRFVFHPYLDRFLPNTCWVDSAWTRAPASMRAGLGFSTRSLRRAIFGANSMDIAEKPVGRLLVDEVLNPFYMFQVGSIVLWCLEDYYYYAACILLMSATGIAETLVETRRNARKLREMAHFTCPVRILRDGAWTDGRAEDLVPGDVFEVVAGMHTLPCDAVLLEGDCIVNESMLTGESIPVAKAPVPPVVFGKMRLASSTFGSDIARHVLFSGTRLVRVKKSSPGFGGARWLDLEQRNGLGLPMRATAMVLRTGFNTTKGALVRSILCPRPNKFKFYEDSFRFIGVLAAIAAVGFLASIGNFLRLGLSAHVIAIRALDLVTVVVPPALPATMSIGVSFALSRLRGRQIYCISPTRINVCGKLNVMCFDKTGTLTEEGLDVLGVQPVDHERCLFGAMQADPSRLLAGSQAIPPAPTSAFSSVGSAYTAGSVGGLAGLDRSASMTTAPRHTADPSKLRVLHALATCHTVKQVDGELVGDPLDIKMLQSTGWVLEESDEHDALPAAGAPPGARVHMPVPAVVRPPHSERFTLSSPTPGANVYELGIIRTFDFSPALRRQSVVTKRLGARYNEVYVKGAPEAVRELCSPDTIPRDFEATLLAHTNHGYRVIALAGRALKMSWPKLQRLKRDAVEQDLVFLGLLVFENKLKPTTAPVLDELRGANIRQIMCTGDNVLTAISVGRECGLIPSGMAVYVPRLVRMREAAPGHTHSGGGSGSGSSACAPAEVRAMVVWEDPESATRVLDPYTLEPRAAASPAPEHLVESDAAETPDEMARQQEQYLAWMHSLTSADVGLATSGNYCVAITGEVFRFVMDALPETTVGRALMRGAIYARMSPDEKAELIESLQRIGYCAGFCGDGANDCGALRAADVGISLSEAEASVAAPFTSHSTDIRCVLEAIREGRAALVTSFSCFKFMALYSIIQFTSVSMLYEFGGGLGDLQFLFIDLFIIIPLAVFMGRTPAFDRIVPKRPTANLMSKKVLTSLFGQIVVNAAIQTAVFRLVKRSAGYTPPTRADPADRDTLLVRSFENSALFLASSFQYVIVGCVFSIGPPYRQSNLHNKGFVATCVALVLFTAYLTLRPDGWCTRVFEMVELSSAFRRVIAGCAVANLALCVVGEAWLFPRMAPAVARYGRIVQYLVRRYVLGRRRLQYDQLPAADSATARAPPAAHAGPAHTATGKRLPEGISAGEASPAGSPSGTVGGGGGSDAYDLESARRMPSWDEIGQKTETKPFKRILREMGIPVRY